VAHFGKDSAKGWSWAQSEINKGINAGENWTNQKVNQAETWTHHQVDRFEHSSIGNNWFGHEFGDGVDTTVKDVGSGVQARADFTGGVAKGITGLITGAAQLPGLGLEVAGDGTRYASSGSFRKKADHTIASAASAVVHHPGAIANHLWNGVKKDWKKDPADFAGQAAVFAASLAAGGVAAGKLGLIGKAGEVTDAAAEGTAEVKGIQQAEQAGQAGAEAVAGSQTGEASKGAEAAQEAGKAGEAGGQGVQAVNDLSKAEEEFTNNLPKALRSSKATDEQVANALNGGGHATAKHVDWPAEKLIAEAERRGVDQSKFYSLQDAVDAGRQAPTELLKQVESDPKKAGEFKEFMSGQKKKLSFDFNMGRPIGEAFLPDKSIVKDLEEVTAVFQRDPNGAIKIKTMYPIQP
jgi:hypothetical protein